MSKKRKRSKPEPDLWKTPEVKEALKERPAWDIAVLDCPKCGRPGYYNEGTHFSCRFCRTTWYVCGEEETPPCDRLYMSLDSLRHLDDTVDTSESACP